MWNYMTYHLVHDYFKAKKKKKTEIQNFEVKNYKAAQKAAEQWIKSVRKFAESSYGVHYPKELYYGATQVLLAVCAEIYRNDHTWNDHRKILVDYIINSGRLDVLYAPG